MVLYRSCVSWVLVVRLSWTKTNWSWTPGILSRYSRTEPHKIHKISFALNAKQGCKEELKLKWKLKKLYESLSFQKKLSLANLVVSLKIYSVRLSSTTRSITRIRDFALKDVVMEAVKLRFLPTGNYLRPCDMEYCVSNTNFSEEEIFQWFKSFRYSYSIVIIIRSKK